MKKQIRGLVITFCLSIVAILTVLPLVYMFVSSFKTNLEVMKVPFEWIPKDFLIENYLVPLAQKPFGHYFYNSAVIASAVTLSQVLTCSLAGYSLSKFNYPGRKFIFLTILTQLMIPFPVIMVPLFLIVRSFGWIDKYQGLIMPLATHAFGIFLMRQFIAEIPNSFIEAARIDGASELQIFSKVIIPLSKTGMVALAVFAFTGNWNEFVWPLVVINTEKMYTLPIALSFFEGMYSTNYPQLMAIALLSAIPTMFVFAVLQRQFTQGIVMSGLKQ